ncbi:MAG: cysteine desulfurase family protein [Planctomycetota bacterium]|jgi:cysteine desulfurase
MDRIYLDNAATTRPADEVVTAMAECLRNDWANPSSVHRAGQAVRRSVELARAEVAELIGCLDRELMFVSGGTEAASLAVHGGLEARPDRPALVTSPLEHSAVRELAQRLEMKGTEVIWLANDRRGVVDIEDLRRVLQARAGEIGVVSVMWVNNETGVIQPVEVIGRLCREFDVWFHCDATQHVGKAPADVSKLPIDLMGFAAHKFHGPKGIGALYVRSGVRLEPQLIGGAQERRRRGGTENVAGIVGFAVAARLAAQWMAGGGPQRLAALRDSFEKRLLEADPEASVNSTGAPRAAGTSNIAFTGLEAEPLLLMLSERGLCASAGAACSSGSLDPSRVLLAMGIPPRLAHGSIRFSLSRETTEQEIDRAVKIVTDVVAKLRSSLATA